MNPILLPQLPTNLPKVIVNQNFLVCHIGGEHHHHHLERLSILVTSLKDQLICGELRTDNQIFTTNKFGFSSGQKRWSDSQSFHHDLRSIRMFVHHIQIIKEDLLDWLKSD